MDHDAALTRLSATELAARIRAGDVTAVDVTEAHIARISEVNAQLNAVVIPLFDEARQQAAAADKALRRGEDVGALHGVPVTIKEQFRVAGTQTTLGAIEQIGNVYHDEGPLVTRLRDTGAIILGKTNIIQTLAGSESDNRVYGRTNNPWNLDRSSGGSSGGEAAIVAAGGSAIGLAGDFGGSTRLPAHFCGVHGFKPTSGRLSNDDLATGLLGYGQEVFISQPGPIARAVNDLSLAMRILAQTSMGATADLVPPVPWTEPDTVDVAGLRVGVYTDNGYFPVSPSIRRVVGEAADGLRRLGATVEPVELPDATEGVRVFLRAISAAGGGDYFRLVGKEDFLPQVAGLFRALKIPTPLRSVVARVMEARGQRQLAALIRQVRPGSAAEYQEIVEARTRYRSAFLQSLDGFDVVICPPVALPAFTHGASEHLLPAVTYALVYNVLGAPAGVVSVSRVRPGEESDRIVSKDMADVTAQQVEQGSAGLPIGVQVVAPHWHDHVVLAVMATLERAFRGTDDYPVTPPL